MACLVTFQLVWQWEAWPSPLPHHSFLQTLPPCTGTSRRSQTPHTTLSPEVCRHRRLLQRKTRTDIPRYDPTCHARGAVKWENPGLEVDGDGLGLDRAELLGDSVAPGARRFTAGCPAAKNSKILEDRMAMHTSAYVSIRQHASAYVSIRQHTSAYVSIRQHTSDIC